MEILTQDAIAFFGGVKELAEKLDITPHAIYQWGEWVPQARVYQLNHLSGGMLPRETESQKAEGAA